MKKILKTLKYISILIVALSFVGCNEDDAVLPKLEAGFTYTVNIDTGTVTFINTSEQSTSYSWDFGDGTTSNLNNPIKTYPNGTYTVELTASNEAGASDTFESEITILIPEIATLPISFDGENTKYDAEVFSGASFSVVDNPDLSGANPTASKVGEIVNSGAAFEGYYFDLGAPIDLTTDKTIEALFWSNSAIDVLLKLEEGTAAAVETTASHGGTGWETIYFTFDSAASYERFTMFVDGAGTTAGTFYIDDITQINSADIPCLETELVLPIDFDCEGIAYTDKIVGNVSFTVVDNPEMSGINNEDTKVGQITNVGANWENAFFNLDTPLNLTTNKGVKLKLFSNQALPIKLKLEDGTEDPIEADVNHTGNGWEELTFAFDSGASYNDMVLFVDGPGTAAGTFYIDDLEQVAVAPPTPTAPTVAAPTPTQDAANVKSIFSDAFTDLAGTNLDTNWQGDLVSETVAIDGNDVIKYSNAKFIGMQLAGDTDFSDMEFLHVDIWTPDATALSITPISPPNEKLVDLAGLKQGEWNSFDIALSEFTGVDFTKILQCKIDAQGGFNPAIVFMDNLYFYKSAGSGGNDSMILDFENNLTGVTPGEFETSGALIANPVSGGINTSANVYEASFTNANQWWGGVGFVFGDGVLDDQATEYKVKLYSTVAPTNVLFEVEVNGGSPVGNVQTINTANQWVEVTFNLANIPAGVNRILIRPDVGDQQTTKPNTGSLYIDDIVCVSCTLNSGGGGTGGGCDGTPTAATSLPVDFESCESFISTFTGDGSITTELADNPDKSGINTSDYVLKVVKASGTSRWAGLQNPFPSNFDMNKTFKIKVYSTKANVVMKFEVNSDPQPPGSGNPGPQYATITAANTWTEVEIVFTGIPGNNTGLNQLVIKPDNPDGTDGELTDSEGIYYFDDIRLE